MRLLERTLYRAIESGDKHVLDSLGMNLCPRCPECRKRRVSPWADGDESGYRCLACGWKKKNLKPIVTEFLCGCGRRMGRLTLHEGERPWKRICGWCAERRIVKGLRPNPNVLVRREVFCACGCGKLVAWNDFAETVPLSEVEYRMSGYFYTPCARAGRQRIFERRRPAHPLPYLAAIEVQTSQPASTINNIGGDITQPVATQLVQSINRNSGPGFWFGNGADGALTLASNTTVAAGLNIKRHTTLDLATFTYDITGFNGATGDFGFIIYCSTSLTSTSGSILATLTGGGASGTGGAAGGGAGGAGGKVGGFIYVYAKVMTGTGTIGTASSIAGANGANGTAPSNALNAGGAGGAAAARNKTYFDTNIAFTAAASPQGGNNGGAAATGGAGATLGVAQVDTDFARSQKDYIRYLFSTGLFDQAQTMSRFDERMNTGTPGSGGGGGANSDTTTSTTANGGGGGGGGAYVGAGATGGNGGTSANGVGSSSGGGGGGGGGASSVTVVVTTSLSSTWTINCDGGKGGNGGNGLNANGNGAGGGGGGSGGICILVAPTGSGVTPTAAGGLGGTKGTGTGNGVDGSAGAAGVAHLVAY